MSGSPPSASTQRVFIALDPPLIVREELASWLRQARIDRHLRAVRPENMHLTLAFLGQRNEAEISMMATILNEFADEAPALGTGAPVWLPPRHPRALAVEIHSRDSTLAGVQSGIASSLTGALGWKEPRAFRPHITVARLRRDFRPRQQMLMPTPQLEFRAESLSIYRSHLLPGGAEYERLHSWLLPAED